MAKEIHSLGPITTGKVVEFFDTTTSRKGNTVNRHEDIRDGESDGVTFFPIDMIKVGGSQGTVTTQATWDYNLKLFGSDEVVGTNVNLNQSAHAFNRPNLGSVSVATFGIAFYDGDNLNIVMTNEVKIYGPCETTTTETGTSGGNLIIMGSSDPATGGPPDPETDPAPPPT
jgi:hypothetical protein